MHDDTGSKLDELQISQPTSIVSSLIRAQQCTEQEGRDFAYFDSLQCLSITRNGSATGHGHELSMVRLPRHDGHFAAVSHVWEASENTDQAVERYHVRLKSGKTRPARIRDDVLDRVIQYTISQSISSFWMDQECINQRDKRAKADAMRVMDIVYRRSHHPVGVLSVPLTHQKHVNHLRQLLEGSCVGELDKFPGRLQPQVSFSKARKILQTLFRVTCDPWWTRRWIFQEEYCTSLGMHLLIPLRPGVKKSDMHDDNLDDFVIDARTFRQQVTRFCIACQDIGVFRSARSQWQCRFVLQRAKSYSMLRKYGWRIHDPGRDFVMSTRILADLCRRSASVQSDTLAIMANCCGYATRLSVEDLEAAGVRSLSLAILALFVLNGEIMKYDAKNCPSTALEFIKRHSFHGFDPPVCDQQLTFMKRCRLSKVQLCLEGIQTSGYLWQCRQAMRFQDIAWQHHDDLCVVLDRIIVHLHGSHTTRLKVCFQKYRMGILPDFLSTTGLKDAFENMVQSIVQAVRNKRSLFFAQLVGDTEVSAVFVSQRHLKMGSTIFTSFEPVDDVAVRPRHRFLDKFVSLQVGQHEDTSGGLPQLKVRNWVNGIWLPKLSGLQQVVFSWPRSLYVEET